MREEQQERRGRFSGFLGGVRLIFDGVLFLFVLFIIGFIVFANGIDREQSEPQETADGIAVLTGALGPVLTDCYLTVRRSEWTAYSAGDAAFVQQGHFEKY